MASITSHLWLVDSKGKVFAASDVGTAVEAVQLLETIPGEPPAASVKWKVVDGRLDRIACGYTGLVCGVQDKILYVRRGVTFEDPVGTSWTKCYCDVVEISVGRESIVRRTSTGEFFACKVDEKLLSPPVFLPAWKPIPRCSLVEGKEQNGIQHFALDARDNMYVVTTSGLVYVYRDVGSVSEDAGRWKEVSKPPKTTSSKGGFSLFSLWRGWKGSESAEGLFSTFSAGSLVSSSSQTLWCLRSGEAWQLVVSEYTGSSGETELRTNWVKLAMPKEDTITAMCCDKARTDALYAIVDEGKALCAFNLLHPDGGRVVLSNPQGFRRSQRWKSIAVCRAELAMQQPTTSASLPLHPSLVQPPSLTCCLSISQSAYYNSGYPSA